MPEINNYTFSLRETAEILIRESNLHEGKWFVSLHFNFVGANMGVEPNNALPSALIQITKIALHRADASSPKELVVDAAEVNPATKSATPSASRRKRTVT